MADKILNLSDSAMINDDNHSIGDSSLISGFASMIPEDFQINEYWKTLCKIDSDINAETVSIGNLIDNVYNIKLEDQRTIENLAKKYGILFPENYTDPEKCFLLKYFPYFAKIKGSGKIFDILTIFENSEYSFYQNPQKRDYSISFISNGYYQIHCSSLSEENLKFCQDIINKLIPIGTCYELRRD